MAFESVFVTGANKGLGLEFVRQLVFSENPPKYVFATYRNENTIQELVLLKESCKKSEVILVRMDVTCPDQIREARISVENIVGSRGLSLLINNAGVCDHKIVSEVTEEGLLNSFRANTVGPILVIKEMLPLLKKAALLNPERSELKYGAAVLNISSFVSSLNDVQAGEVPYPYAYRISKTALNMAMRAYAASPEIQDSGVLSLLICPGWVRTDMGSQMAPLSPQDSVFDMLATLKRADLAQQGWFVDRVGNKIAF